MTGQIAGYNTGDIVSGLQSRGWRPSTPPSLHSALRSLGRVIRRSGEHCRGFLDVLGKEGTLAMPNSAASSPRETIRSWTASDHLGEWSSGEERQWRHAVDEPR